MKIIETNSMMNYFKSNKTFQRILIMLAFALILTGCASHYAPDSIDDPYGFFSGIWHGFVFPLSLVTNIFSWFMSLFDIYVFRDIQIIGRPNTGFFYYVGFILGLSGSGGGAGTATR